MKTDLAFADMFSHNPGWLGELTGLDLPEASRAGPKAFKGIEREADWVLEPLDPQHPHYVVEFQMQLDNSIYQRLNLYRTLHWLSIHDAKRFSVVEFKQADIREVVIFGTREKQPRHLPVPPGVTLLFLDEALDSLKGRDPGSPLLPALAPLTEETTELELNAAKYYNTIQGNPVLESQAREVLLDIFKYFLYQHFDHKTEQEFKAMIAKLTPIQETRVGRDLIEQGIEQGIEQRNREIVLRMNASGMDVDQIVSVTGIPKEAVLEHLAAE